MSQVEERVIEKLPEEKKSLRNEYISEIRLMEALLFASQRPLKAQDIEDRLPVGVPVMELISELKNDYLSRGVNLVNIAGGWTFRTADDLKDNLRSLVQVKRRLSAAAIETLAIIAYHQPVTRGDIETIRGVAVSKGTLDTLLECNWIRPRGRRRVPGRPLQWGTSEEFLEYFSLENLNDLPGIEELKATGLLEKRDSLTSLILPDDLPVEDDSGDQDELFPLGYGDGLEDC
jgi:segregation and condensation protein B